MEAGAQGEHKIQRGYLPRLTFSSHYICSPQLRERIQGSLRRCAAPRPQRWLSTCIRGPGSRVKSAKQGLRPGAGLEQSLPQAWIGCHACVSHGLAGRPKQSVQVLN